ncbi:lipopolysaccharide biosynthesis protein [Sphingomonas sp. 28-63-12]|uniref:lipopolysaccharide biosynthesis protein n=1 Tax=Sphingomonas sp. 28-63-12 TaxID=1970434 RepID=UPI000BCD5705|nr:MAG: lipopolysaccharide biosynthesis protein [Sphingomonas sp. 28-63-12]
MESPLTPPNRESETLASQVRSAVIWRSGSQILAQLVQWSATFLVIRILAPADYGLFAMTQVVILFLTMLNGYGLASGLIQQSDVTERQIRQLFGMMVLLNGVLAITQLLLAPIAAAYYRQPIVGQMLQVQALLYVTIPFMALAYALLSRSMDFRAQAKVNIIASIASATAALGGALAGMGVWTLVVAPLVMFSVRAIGMTVAARSLVWPIFDFRGAGHLARYGGLMAIGQLFWFVESQADVFIAGRSLDPHWLGIYTTSLFLTQIFVSKVVPPLNEVAFSAYARLQHDGEAVARAFARSVRVIMTAALPFYVGLAVTAEPLVLTMLGPKWAEAAPIVRILACAMPLLTLQVLFSPACDAKGRPGISVQNGATGAVLLTLAYLIGIQWGVIGLAWSWLAAYPLYLGISLWRSLPVIGVSARALLQSILPPLIAALGMGVVVMMLGDVLPPLPAPLRLVILVAVGAVVYVGWLGVFARGVIGEIMTIIRRQPVVALV